MDFQWEVSEALIFLCSVYSGATKSEETNFKMKPEIIAVGTALVFILLPFILIKVNIGGYKSSRDVITSIHAE